MITDTLLREGVREWMKCFEKRPKTTLILTILAFSTTAVITIAIDQSQRTTQEAKRRESLTYTQQLQRLNDTEANLHQLIEFVNVQKTTLRESEDVIAQLKKKHEELAPVVTADQKVIEAIFNAQEQRNTTSVWRERGIGFAFGVIGSYIASFLWQITLNIRRKTTSKATPAA